MDAIIGLGSAGCRIADKFSQYPQYEIYKMDVGLKRTSNTYGIKEKSSPEEYENSIGNLRRFFKDIKGDVLFVIGGSSYISAASLRVVQQLRDCNVTVLYVYSDPDLLGEIAKKHQKVTASVLQQYARSAALESLILIDNNQLEIILDNVPVIGFYDYLNDLFVPTIHMVNVLKNSESIIDNIANPHEVSRIISYGIVDYETGKEKLFFPLDNIREKVYYYAINEERLKASGDLRKKIISQVKQNSIDTTTSYGIYSTQYDEDYVYCVAYSSTIQKIN